ncbi:MAG: YesL family protein [Clostridia bacterium]|nr:YesL family protein [Clostridia bacterium]
MENKKKSKRLRLFDLQRDGKGISKNQADMTPGLKRFFLSYINNFGKIVSTNIIMVLGNFPIIFLIAALSGATKNSAFLPMSDLFQNVNGLFEASGANSPYTLSLFALEGLQNQALVPSAWTYVFYGIGALTIFTFGPINAATAYILRNLASGEPVFVWTDFIYALKRNIKQSLPFGIIDIGICALLLWNIYNNITTGSFLTSLFFWTNVIIFILYFFMRFYIYVQMVTFKLTVFKIFKNSLIFALLGFKRNILALLGIILLVVIEFLLLFSLGGLLMPFAIAAPLAVLFSTFAYMKVYASYYKIKEVMIDPYYEEHPDERPETYEDEEVIMTDDVTEKERLEEIKKRNNIE